MRAAPESDENGNQQSGEIDAGVIVRTDAVKMAATWVDVKQETSRPKAGGCADVDERRRQPASTKRALYRNAEQEYRQQQERDEADQRDDDVGQLLAEQELEPVIGVDRKLAIDPVSFSRTTPTAVIIAGISISRSMMMPGMIE